MNARRYLRRLTRWAAIVLTAVVCVLLLLLLIFPIRYISADTIRRERSDGVLLMDSMPELPEPPQSELSRLPHNEQKRLYEELKGNYLHSVSEFTQKVTQSYTDRYVIERVQSSGTGAYIVDLSSGRYLIIVVGKRMILKVKIG